MDSGLYLQSDDSKPVSSHKRIVEKLAECFSRQDWQGMLSFMTDDIERYEVGSPERIRGRAAFEQNMRPGPEVASMRSKIARMTEEGNVVCRKGPFCSPGRTVAR